MCYNGNSMLNKDPINMYVIYKLNESWDENGHVMFTVFS